MASEIALGVSLTVTKSGQTISGSASKVLDLAGDEALAQLVSIGFAADQALDLSALNTVGQLLVHNLDATNYVELSYDTGGSFTSKKFAKIRPGCACLLEPSSATIYAQANTAACVVRICATEV